jgi:hypothetical protein
MKYFLETRFNAITKMWYGKISKVIRYSGAAKNGAASVSLYE